MDHKPNENFDLIECTSVAQFLEYLNPIQPHWNRIGDSTWIFRGQSDASWDLQPSAWRPLGQETLTSFRPRLQKYEDRILEMFQTKSNNPERATELTMHIATEYEAVHQFIDLADELGFVIPRKGYEPEYSGIEYLERVLDQKHFERFSSALTFTLAQHHGIPTRLLDWTRSSLKASYFATLSTSKSTSEKLAVWCINIGRFDGTTFPYPFEKITCPRSNHSFLHSQDGLFLAPVFDRADRYYLENGKWPNLLGELLSSSGQSERIVKVTLPRALTSELTQALWLQRISKAHLMPTLNHVSDIIIAKSRGANP